MTMDEQIALAERLDGAGWGVISPHQYLIDIEPEFLEVWNRIAPYSMTSVERAYALYGAVCHLEDRAIAGDFVECGVWRGGSCMLMAQVLLARGNAYRDIHLFDTFTGMTEPTDEDRIAWNGKSVRERFKRFDSWAVDLPEVERNLGLTRYPSERLHFVKGDVLETLDGEVPERIALLRLDTDWYESTRKELETLYPALVSGGILILDDFGHFEGARKAVEDYFANRPRPFLTRVDYTGRVGIK